MCTEREEAKKRQTTIGLSLSGLPLLDSTINRKTRGTPKRSFPISSIKLLKDMIPSFW